MTSTAETEQLKARLEEQSRRAHLAEVERDQAVAELERLRQRETAMRRAIAHEHQRSNGSSVYMQGPPQHERSRMTCKHPLCAAVAQAEQPDA